MGDKKALAVRVYSVNQPKVDEACQEYAELILDVASPEKLADIRDQIIAHLKASK